VRGVIDLENNHNPKKHLFYCFHGTTKTNADKIVREKNFIWKKRSNHWLGKGVYFFIDDSDKAKWWASKCIKDKDEKVVVETEVCIDNDRLFNLDTEQAKKYLDKYIKEAYSNMVVRNAMVEPNKHLSFLEMRCVCLDVISKINSYQAIKCTFLDKKIKYEYLSSIEGGIMNTACQLCVKDCSIIKYDKIRVYSMEEV